MVVPDDPGEREIDPFSDYTLHDVIDESQPHKPMGDFRFEYNGFHIVPRTGDKYHVQLDGHAGSVFQFKASDYDDVLKLVADLNSLWVLHMEYQYQDDTEALVDWAGKIMTSHEEKAEENPELYIYTGDAPTA